MAAREKRGRIGTPTEIMIMGALACAFWPTITIAQSAATQSSIPSDGGAVKAGDVIIWKVNKTIQLESDLSGGQTPSPSNAGTAADTAQTVCFPVNGRFDVTSVVAATKSNSAGSSTGATASNTQIVSGHFSSDTALSWFHWRHFHALPGIAPPKPGAPAPQTTSAASACGAAPLAAYDVTYNFTADRLNEQDFYRQGFTWGGLVIPYKYYFSDHSIKSNSSVVGFVGYEGWFPGVSLSGVVALGPGTAPTTSSPGAGSTSNAASSSITAVTYTAALGVIASFGASQTLKAGLMIGRDYQSNPANFPYENKTWMALSIGAGF